MADVTQILNAVEAGDPRAPDRLLALVYDELRRLAAAQMARERPGQTLDATALVHEVYVRLVAGAAPAFANRRHFFGAAAEAMRRILIDSARRKRSVKHGGGLARRDVADVTAAAPEDPDDLLALDEALGKLAAADPAAAELVRLRFFAGLPLPQVAAVLGISPRSADRLWAYARAWLHQEIAG